MEAETQSVAIDVGEWPPIAPMPLAEAAVASLVDAIQRAARPLIVTSYVGRNPTAVTELVRFCGRLGVGVLEFVPSYVNFPHNDPLYQGNHWNHPFQNRALAEADFILVVDSDVPWIPTVSKPSDGRRDRHHRRRSAQADRRRSGPSRRDNVIEPMRRPPSRN